MPSQRGRKEIMSQAITKFENFWRQMDLGYRERYVHPADASFMTPLEVAKSKLQLQVLPLPVNGNLRRADVILVMLVEFHPELTP